jgi:Trypsin-like peptidase domain/FHA domain
MRRTMIVRRCVLAVSLALAVIAGPRADAAPERDNFEFLQTSTVRVVARLRNGLVQGTGFIVVRADPARNANNAVIITALHVVRGADRITVVEANSGDELEANLRARDFDRDLAFLEVRGLRNGGTPLPVTGVVPPVGQELRTTGYSNASDQVSRQAAEISGVLLGAYSRTIPNPRPIWSLADVGVAQFQHSIPITVGFSGGPVIDKCGRVVGFNVSNGGTQLGDVVLNLEPGISFAVASTEIIKAAQDNGIRLTEDGSPCPDPSAPRLTAPAQNGNAVPADAPAGKEPAATTPFYQTRTGLAVIVGAFAVIALGLSLWLFFGRSGRSRAGPSQPLPAARDSLRLPTAAPAPAQTAAAPTSASTHSLTLRGTGPGGEPINLRFTSDELQARPRTIGTESEVSVPDNRAKTFVSRNHAEISWDGDSFYIKDLKSVNGTQVDGQDLKPLEQRRLHDGATIKLADVALVAQID